MKYGYYPGCSALGVAKELDLSTRAVFSKLDLEIPTIAGWNCCGASPAHVASEELSLALSARNIALAEEQKIDKIITSCAACYSRLRIANAKLKKDTQLLKRINAIIGKEYKKSVDVIHMLDLLTREWTLEELKKTTTKSLNGMKVACYYGCLLTRPPEYANIDPDPENPRVMDSIVDILGGKPIDWSHKTECCGASFALSRTDIVLRLSNEILKAATYDGADCIAVACPLCHANLDMRQSQIAQKYGTDYSLPIIYITQLVALCQGKGYRGVGLDKHIVDPKVILKDKEII